MKLQSTIKSLKKSLKKNGKEIDEYLLTLSNNYTSDLVKYQEELLMNICQDHSLSYEDLHNKYIKSFKKSIKKKKNSNLIDNSDSESENNEGDISNLNIEGQSGEKTQMNILEKVSIQDKVCYIENEGGIIYNSEVMKIGEVKSNGEYFLYD